jgi:hypothetical protein
LPAIDTDGDGCTDQRELGLDPRLGGLRDPLNPWDFFDPTRNRLIDADDVLQVTARFATSDPNVSPEDAFEPPTSPTGYYAGADRGPLIGPYSWSLGPPNGTISIDDITAVLIQFGHRCL